MTQFTTELLNFLDQKQDIDEFFRSSLETAMKGELDFETSLRKRVSLLKGLSIDVFDKIHHKLHFSKNATQFVKVLQENQIEVGLVSGGFTDVVKKLANDLGIRLFTANQLEIRDGYLTGNIKGPVISKEVKESTLLKWADELEVPIDRTIAIGDGANDLAMLKRAGIGIGFCAKEIVKEEIPLKIEDRDLTKVLNLIDFL